VAFLCLAAKSKVDEAESLPDGQTIRAPFSVKPWLNPVKRGFWLKGKARNRHPETVRSKACCAAFSEV